jgi:branched-chain amino acid aminotransferase
MLIYLDGSYVPQENAKVSVLDHGLLYGDGVFEGIRLYDNCVFKLDEHIERLYLSAHAILLEIPMNQEAMAEAVLETCRQNNLRNGYIRLVVTRGVGSLGLSPKGCKPSVIIIASSIQLYPPESYEKGLKIITSATRRNSPAALPPMIKSLNYLNSVLAKIEAQAVGFQEALMLNDQGYVAECTGDNVFIIKKGTIYTPYVASGSLKGITREVVFEIAAELNVPIEETLMTRFDVWTADECFLTGTAAEVIPAVELDGRKIGAGIPGELTRRFIDAFRARVSQDGRML